MGSVVVSLDAELGWGFHDMARPPTSRIEAARESWERLRTLFDEHDVPATWAIVGHLFLDDCDGKHADHPTPEGWFERERSSWSDRPDLRFAPDLVRRLLDAPTDHEIGSHTFSHVLFDDPGTTREIARAELERSVELAEAWDLSLSSFIYPRNGVAHRRQLAATGFSAYRGRAPTPGGPRGVYETLVRDRSQLVEPVVDEFGLVDVPASMFCFGFEGVARTVVESVWEDPMVARARRGIDEAASDDGVFHLWLHPNNLTTERDLDRMRAIVEYVDRRRSETSLRVETMGEVASRVLASSRPGTVHCVTNP